MARIFRTDIYDYDTLPSLEDYVIGTDSEDSLRTKNYRIIDILSLVGAVVGDNLGDHIATQALDMDNNDITGVDDIIGHTDNNSGIGEPFTGDGSNFFNHANLARLSVANGNGEFWNINKVFGDHLTFYPTSVFLDSEDAIGYKLNVTGTPANAQDLITKSYFEGNLAGITNTTSFTPTADYHVATKKYVDDNAGGVAGGIIGVDDTSYTNIGTGTELAATITAAAAGLSTAIGDAFRFTAGGRMNGSGSGSGTKTINLTLDLDAGSQGLNVTNYISVTTNGVWRVEALVTRTSSTAFVLSSLSCYHTTTGGTTKSVPSIGSSGSALTYATEILTFKVNIASSVASTLTYDNATVEFIPAL